MNDNFHFALYALADRKRMTVKQLLANLTDAREMSDWFAFYERKAEMENKQ